MAVHLTRGIVRMWYVFINATPSGGLHLKSVNIELRRSTLLRDALVTSSDLEMLAVLQVGCEEIPEALKTLQCTLERPAPPADKVQDVRDFLKGALTLVKAEPDTPFWYVVEFPGTCVFSIVDFFAANKGWEEHVNGKVVFASVDKLLASQPDIVKFDVLSADIKSKSAQMGDPRMKNESSMANQSGIKDDSGMNEDSRMQTSVVSGVSLTLLMPAIATGDQVNATQKFLEGAIPLVQAEPGTIQWYGETP
ncbi:hypothetical protein B0H14DRAFT_3444027 [Mycena olivaceomarginata]|nr:hypothetical protein B0H14DRAFT_3444027 [Mycena olivaceomarginata]